MKLYGPFTSAKRLRGAIAVLQRIFKFRTCGLDIVESEERWRWFRPCLLASINQCTAPCNLRISREDYAEDIRRLRMFLDGRKQALLDELHESMQAASRELKFERAARIRDEIKAIENLNLRGDLREHAQPEAFYIDPKARHARLQKIFSLSALPRRIEGMDIAHLQGGETVASLVQSLMVSRSSTDTSGFAFEPWKGSTILPRCGRWSAVISGGFSRRDTPSPTSC